MSLTLPLKKDVRHLKVVNSPHARFARSPLNTRGEFETTKPPLTLIPSSEKRGTCLQGTRGVLNSINASLLSLVLLLSLFLSLVLTLTLILSLTLILPLPLPLCLPLPLVGVPVGRDMKKVVFCILRFLTSACLRHDFYVMPSSEALQKIIFFMPSGGSFSFRYLFFWTSKRKGTTLSFKKIKKPHP